MPSTKTKLTLLSLVFSAFANAQHIRTQGVTGEMIAGPAALSQCDQWLDSIKTWRKQQLEKLQFNDRHYTNKAFKWVPATFIYAQMMAHDRYFYDPVTQQYTVDKYLDDLIARYGGLDAVLIWPTYPNIGVDDRNQFDMFSYMPGGKKALKQMISDFHNRGVKVFFPIMIWDNGTRRISESMAIALAKEVKELGADGLNGDTMDGVTLDFANAWESLHYPIALQPELRIKDLKMLEYNNMSWGYFWRQWDSADFGYQPGVSMYKWLQPKHQVHITDRWAVNKTEDLQYAFFNGIGYNAWENIWGVWNQVPERYAMAIRKIRTIYQQFPLAWSDANWEPFYPVQTPGVFASRFPDKMGYVITLVNRDNTDKSTVSISLPHTANENYYDAWNGKQLTPDIENGMATLHIPIEANGFGAIRVQQTGSLTSFLQTMKGLSARRLQDLSDNWEPLQQKITEIPATERTGKTPDGMVLVPGNEYNFHSVGNMIEGDPLPKGVGVQHPWEKNPGRDQRRQMKIPDFYIDQYPVTNGQYHTFLKSSHYRPADTVNFLKDWVNGKYLAGEEELPVTWVSIEDARAYAQWAGKRLPHEWEWQFAAQGTDGRLYPWGPHADSLRIPPPDAGREMRRPSKVNAYPGGSSPFGIMDMVGNIWQWTDEYTDEHTRSAVLKGGSYYRPQTSNWYLPHALEVHKYAKYLLISPGMDRARTIGFRCIKDKLL